MQRESATAEVAGQFLEMYYATDVRSLLPVIGVRTLVVHREGDQVTRFDLGREVAALIPGATLVPLPGVDHLFYSGRQGVVEFLAVPAAAGPRLTIREAEVAALVAEGLTNHAIATRLGIAPRTAEAHVENIRRKLEVRSRAQIAAWATEQRLHGAR